MEAIFERVPGVTDVVSGYSGGKENNPNHDQVGGGKTGHTEAVEITYDADKTSYAKLLDVFWKSHDPLMREASPPTSANNTAPPYSIEPPKRTQLSKPLKVPGKKSRYKNCHTNHRI